jgi:AcrR family transcriptional regulator
MFPSRKARSPQPAVPLPASPEGLGEADGWAVLESLGHEVFLRMHDGERIGYDELLEDFREDPQGEAGPALTPVVASGITISSALVYILPVTAWLLKIATERVAGQAVDALSDTAREKIRHLLRSHRSQPLSGGPAADGSPVPLAPDEEQAALASLAAWAESIGADADQACEVARAVIRALHGNEGRGR